MEIIPLFPDFELRARVVDMKLKFLGRMKDPQSAVR